MPRRIVVICGHPDPAGGHFCNALADAYSDAARAAGHVTTAIDIGSLDLPWVTDRAGWEARPTLPQIVLAQAAIAAADHLVLVYPLWLGTMPARLKAFLEQVTCGGAAISVDERGHWHRHWSGKSARIVVTMGMPALAYRLWFGAHSLKSLERNILRFAGVAPVRSMLVGMVEGRGSEARRDRALDRVTRLGARGA